METLILFEDTETMSKNHAGNAVEMAKYLQGHIDASKLSWSGMSESILKSANSYTEQDNPHPELVRYCDKRGLLLDISIKDTGKELWLLSDGTLCERQTIQTDSTSRTYELTSISVSEAAERYNAIKSVLSLRAKLAAKIKEQNAIMATMPRD